MPPPRRNLPLVSGSAFPSQISVGGLTGMVGEGRGFPARLTARPGTGGGADAENAYGFIRVQDDDPDFPDQTDSPDQGDGITLAAYELAGRTDVPTGTGGAKVWLYPLAFRPGYAFRYETVPPGFFARLTSTSTISGVARWNYVRLTLDADGVWGDSGAESTGYPAVPSTIDGAEYAWAAAGLRVWMVPSSQSGLYEFRPINFADATHGGLLTGGPALQQIGGPKQFVDAVQVTPAGSALYVGATAGEIEAQADTVRLQTNDPDDGDPYAGIWLGVTAPDGGSYPPASVYSRYSTFYGSTPAGELQAHWRVTNNVGSTPPADLGISGLSAGSPALEFVRAAVTARTFAAPAFTALAVGEDLAYGAGSVGVATDAKILHLHNYGTEEEPNWLVATHRFRTAGGITVEGYPNGTLPDGLPDGAIPLDAVATVTSPATLSTGPIPPDAP